jgi:predicted DNA-binding protein
VPLNRSVVSLYQDMKIRFPRKRYTILTKLAKANGIAVNKIVNEAVQQYLEDLGPVPEQATLMKKVINRHFWESREP